MTDDTAPEMNEIAAAAHEHKRVREAADASSKGKRGDWPLLPIGIGVGVGSAALVAALLYANRSRGDRD